MIKLYGKINCGLAPVGNVWEQHVRFPGSNTFIVSPVASY